MSLCVCVCVCVYIYIYICVWRSLFFLIQLYDKGPSFGLSTAWLSKFVNTLEKLIDDMASAFELSSLLNNWQEIDQVSFLGTLQNFMHNNSPEKIFQEYVFLVL